MNETPFETPPEKTGAVPPASSDLSQTPNAGSSQYGAAVSQSPPLPASGMPTGGPVPFQGGVPVRCPRCGSIITTRVCGFCGIDLAQAYSLNDTRPTVNAPPYPYTQNGYAQNAQAGQTQPGTTPPSSASQASPYSYTQNPYTPNTYAQPVYSNPAAGQNAYPPYTGNIYPANSQSSYGASPYGVSPYGAPPYGGGYQASPYGYNNSYAQAPYQKRGNKTIWLVCGLAALFLVIFIACVALFSSWSGRSPDNSYDGYGIPNVDGYGDSYEGYTPPTPDGYSLPSGASDSELADIKNGMSYALVAQIIGGDGTLVDAETFESITEHDTRDYDSSSTIYAWPGENDVNMTLFVVFTDGHAVDIVVSR